MTCFCGGCHTGAVFAGAYASALPSGTKNGYVASPLRSAEFPLRSLSAALCTLLFVFGLADSAKAAGAPTPERSVDMATVLKPGPLPELTMGPSNGIPVIEYGSLTCPHCAAFEKEVLPKLKAAYVDTGKIEFIFREYSRNPLDVAAFVLARCVGDDKTLPTIALLFASQDRWAFVDSPLEPLLTAVRPTGLSRDKGMACLKDNVMAAKVQQIQKTANDVVKLQGTPTFVINGKVYGGELTMAEFDTILQPLIKDVAVTTNTAPASPMATPSPAAGSESAPK